VYFFTGVSVIHKLIVPVVLHATTLAKSEYARIDLMVALPVLLSGYLLARRRTGWLGSMLAGSVIGYSSAESYEILAGKYPAWLSFSHGLSAIPIGGAAFFLMVVAPDRILPAAFASSALTAGAVVLCR
jgi:hypothetical protein